MNYAKLPLLKSVLILQISILHHCFSASDTLSGNQTLRDDGSVLVSKAGTYVLGFFKPGKSNSKYLGIWFGFSNETVVWVANRNNPINDTTGVLSLDLSHNLILSDRKSPSFWRTSVDSESPAKNVEAQISDSGNLILRRDGEIVWQSFDHPTNVLLSGMKVGLNRKTGLDRSVTAWKSPSDPGSGNCTLRMDTAGSAQLMLYKNRSKYWRAGHWNGLQWSGVPALGALPERNLFNITFADDDDEVTVMWNVLDPSIFPYVFVDAAGYIRQYAWQGQDRKWVEIYTAPGDNCDKYARCGFYGSCYPYNVSGFECGCLPGYQPVSPHDWALQDGSGGCRRGDVAPSMCGAGEGFVPVRSVKGPDTSGAVVDRKLGRRECREECLRNCSCLAYAAADISNGESGCIRWYGGLVDVKQFLQGGQDLYLRVDKFELAKYAKSGGLSGKWIAAIVVVTVFGGLIIIASVLCWLRKTRDAEKIMLGQPSLSYDARGSSTGFKGLSRENSTDKSDICFFDLSTIAVATDNFSSANKLGQGGFGSVYKGALSNGEELAVKRLSQFSGQGTEEFKNEVVLIAKLQHRNLVKLLGCCIHNEEKMLIYEFMPNKSLDLVLFDKNKKSLLVWRQRSTIIFGIARGLLYLHQDSRLKIIHRDLKASNVLLDAMMSPKISDFGMARMFGDDQIEANTNKVVGTYGYMSPEYAMEGLYSIKSDVFSFGVLTLEIITGKKNSNFNEVSSLNLVGQVWDLWKEEKALEIVDESLGESYPVNQVLRWIQIGLLCVQELAVDRPSMLEVMFMLGNETPLPSPKRPAFIYKNSSSETSTSKGFSVNDITVTVMEPR